MINIHGKEYMMVNERVKAFRDNFPGYALLSEIVKLTDDTVVIKATIEDENGRVIATGHAQEDRTSSQINSTSYVENGETSAWGRALANLGIGIDVAISSADELTNALVQQSNDKASDKQIAYLKTLIKKMGWTEDEYLASYGYTSFDEMPKKDVSLDINKLKEKTK